MPWRDQVMAAWRVIRWLWWPAGWPAWAPATIWICDAVIVASLVAEAWWGAAGAVAICAATGAVVAGRKAR